MIIQPVLFLDFDGVINTSHEWQTTNSSERILPIRQECVDRLFAFATEVDAQIVISSSWRKLHSVSQLQSWLPTLAPFFHDDWRTGSDRRGHRGNEVIEWLDAHNWPAHVIFDDDSDFYQFQPFVHTHMHTGCTDIHIQQARSILRAQLHDPIAVVPGLGYKQADLLESRCEYIAHGCNAQGVMGSGVARAIRDKWPKCYDAYRAVYESQGNRLDLGQVIWFHEEGHLVGVDPYRYEMERFVGNCITQEFYGRSEGHTYVDYDATIEALRTVGIKARDDNCLEVGIPLIGCALGGGKWSIMSKRIKQLGQEIGVRFTVCIPDLIQRCTPSSQNDVDPSYFPW